MGGYWKKLLGFESFEEEQAAQQAAQKPAQQPTQQSVPTQPPALHEPVQREPVQYELRPPETSATQVRDAEAAVGRQSPYHPEPPLNPNETWVRFRRPWPLAARLVLIAVVIFGVLGGAAFLAYSWVRSQIDPPGSPGREVLVAIPQGASTNDIARILADENVVANALVTRFAWRGDGPYQAGDYQFNRNMSLSEAEAVLAAGPLVLPGKSVTLPEGLWLTDIADRLLDALPEFDEGDLNSALYTGSIRSRFQPEGNINLEGLLFPDTYQVGEDDFEDEAGLIARMAEQFDEVAAELGYSEAQARIGLTPYEVIIVASMVEEEARVPEDRAKIARVIYNRIAQDMRLEIDATVLYAIQRHTAELTQADLAVDSPYNTRLYKGLPPTPIATPGRAALEAALNPVEGDWLFYVLADADGSHFFTDSYDEFLNQVNRSRAEGLF